MVRRLLVLTGFVVGCGGDPTLPIFSSYPPDIDLGTVVWTAASSEIRWIPVTVQNEGWYPLDLRSVEVVGDDAPFVEARFAGGLPEVQAPVRGGARVEIRVRPPEVIGVETWSSGARTVTLRFVVGGTGSIDQQTQQADLNAYRTVDVEVPVRFELSCDRDGDRADHIGCSGGQDCDDLVAAVNPGAVEVCDGIDNDCDGDLDQDDQCIDEDAP